MLINVKVKANAKINLLSIKDNLYTASLAASPINNKANKSLIKLLSDHFNISQSQIEIVKGLKSKNKIIKIE